MDRSFGEEPRRGGQNAPFALERFDDDRADVVPHRLLDRRGVSVGDVRHRTEGPEPLAVLRRARHRQCTEGAAVERVVEGDDADTLLLPREEEVVARELEEGLVRLGARIAEEGAGEARTPAELVREADVRLVEEVVGHVHDARRLLGDGARECRVPMADRAHGDARAEVEPAPTIGVEKLAAAAAHDGERRGLVIGIEALAGEGDEVGVRGSHLDGGVAHPAVHRWARISRATSAKPAPIGRSAT